MQRKGARTRLRCELRGAPGRAREGLASRRTAYLVVVGHAVQGFHEVGRPLKQHLLQGEQGAGGDCAGGAASAAPTRRLQRHGPACRQKGPMTRQARPVPTPTRASWLRSKHRLGLWKWP